MTDRRRALDEAIMICRRVEARWAQVHSVAPSAAAECASEIEALRDAAPSAGDAWIGSIPDLPLEAILAERGAAGEHAELVTRLRQWADEARRLIPIDPPDPHRPNAIRPFYLELERVLLAAANALDAPKETT